MPELVMLLVSGHIARKPIPKKADTAEVVDRFWKQPALEGCKVDDVGDGLTVICRHVVAFEIE